MGRPSGLGDLRARIALGIWSFFIVLATVPLKDFVGHPHWQKVQWVPFVSPPVRATDIVGNVLLYFPFGYGLIRSKASGRPWRAAAIATGLSMTLEWSQLYSHARFPSVQDVVCDVFGAWVGAHAAWLARARHV